MIDETGREQADLCRSLQWLCFGEKVGTQRRGLGFWGLEGAFVRTKRDRRVRLFKLRRKMPSKTFSFSFLSLKFTNFSA